MRVEVVGVGPTLLGDDRGELLLPLAHPLADAGLDGRGAADDARHCPLLVRLGLHVGGDVQRRPTKRRQQRLALGSLPQGLLQLVEAFRALVEDDVLLGLEVGEERPGGDVGRRGDGGDGGRLEPPFQEQLEGRLPQRLARALLLPLPDPQFAHDAASYKILAQLQSCMIADL
ncbi:MAG TPA: hypothetical protein VFA45_01000 [Actinomycetes bacterium]|nr:hypothetical protein [Actinomycetes bacterium]